MKKSIIIVNAVWLALGVIALITGYGMSYLGSSSSVIYYPKEYINGDAYNYIIEAALMGGKMSMFAGSVVRNTIICAAGLIVMFFSSCGLIKELSKWEKKVEIKQDNLEIKQDNNENL